MRFLCLLIGLFASFLLVSEGLAREGALTYSRTHIIIMRASADADSPPPLPWRDAQASADSPGIIFDVEIRDASILYHNDGWYNLSGPSEKSGVMLMFSAPTIAPLMASAQYAPLDILMVDSEGTINQILPNLMLSQLTEEIMPERPVKAFLFLQGGICKAMGIQPGDRVLYKKFRQPPTVLSIPAKAAATPALPVLPFQAAPTAALPAENEATEHKAAEDRMKDPMKDRMMERRRPTGPLMVPVP